MANKINFFFLVIDEICVKFITDDVKVARNVLKGTDLLLNEMRWTAPLYVLIDL